MLGDPGQPVCLCPDVGNEVPQGHLVHGLVLENGVCQQPDGGQRGLQLVGGVGYEAPAHLLRGLETVSELVKLLRQQGQLVPARGLEPVPILPLPHNADGAEQGGKAGGEHLGEKQAHHQGHRRNHQGDAPQIFL